MDIANVVDITASVALPSVVRLSFGEPCIRAYNIITPASTPVLRYSTSTWSADLLADGFTAEHPVYLCAQAIARQDIKPRTFKVMRSTLTFSHDCDITVLTDTVGETLTITLTAEDPAVAGTLISVEYTRTCAGGGVNAEATALAATIQAGIWGAAVDITAAAVGPVIQIRAQAGHANKMVYYSGVTNLSIADVTVARATTDITAGVAYDPDWYCLLTPDAGTLDVVAVSTAVNGLTNKVYACNTQDRTVVSAGTGVANTLRLANDDQTGIVYTAHGLNENPAAAWAARHLAEDPGTEVWAFKALSGVTPSTLTAAQSAFAHADYCNTYEGTTIGGQTVITGWAYRGWTSGSAQTFMDRVRLVDATVAAVQEELLALFSASRKVPYNDAGIGMVKASILAGVRRFEGLVRGYAPNSAYCEVPAFADTSAVDRAARNLNNVTFGAQLNGAIMKVTISATLSI
jgi:hypothetical protein